MTGRTEGGEHPHKSRVFQRGENHPASRCHSPTPSRYAPIEGSGGCKTIREHRASPGRGPLVPTGRLRAVARPRSRRRRVRPDPAPRPCPRRRTTLGPAPRPCPCPRRRTTRGPAPRPCPCRTCRPVGAAAHHPLAGLGAPAALGRLVPRRCHSRHPPCPPVHRPGRAGRRSGLCRLAGADPPAAHHREHGRPPAPPGARPTQDHPPKIYPWPGGRRGQAGGQGRPKYQPAPMSAARARR